MPAQGFFETFAPDDVAKTVSAMALKKMDLDQANRQVKMAEEKWNLEKTALKDKLDRQKLFRQSLIDQITQKSNVLGQINPEHPELKALDVIKTGLITGGLDTDKAVAGLVDLEQKNLPTPKLVNYIDPKDPTKSRVVVEGRELPPAGYVTEATFRAMKSGTQPTVASLVSTTQDPNATQDDKDRADRILKGIKDQNTQDPSWQSSSVTEKGGFPVWKNPKTKETVIRRPDGTEENYDPAKHGKELSPTLSQTTIFGSNEKEKTGFKSWTPEAKEQTFRFNMLTGKEPVNTKGMRSGDRQIYGKEYAQWQVDKGFTPGMIARMQTDYRAMDKSVSNQEKSHGMMTGFVINLDKQVDKVEEMFKKLPRTDLKIFNIPIKDLRTYVAGSGEEAAVQMYLIEISNEAGKLSTNSAASIQELSQSAQVQWKKIHDETMPVGEMIKVLRATKNLGHDRLNSTREAIKMTRDAIEEVLPGSSGGPVPGRIKVNPADVKIIKR